MPATAGPRFTPAADEEVEVLLDSPGLCVIFDGMFHMAEATTPVHMPSLVQSLAGLGFEIAELDTIPGGNIEMVLIPMDDPVTPSTDPL